MLDEADKAVEVDENAWAAFHRSRAAREPVDKGTAPSLQPIDCIECGATVSVARQVAVPRTRRCTPCADFQERA